MTKHVKRVARSVYLKSVGRRGFLGVIALGVAGLFSKRTPAAEVEIGAVRYGAYEGAEGHRENGQVDQLHPWTPVYLNEKIITPSTGATRLVFLDDTTLRIGPSSELTLDRFVYDPATSQGAVLINLSAGVMRFVTGDVSTAEGTVQMQTPHATITVRGTDVVIQTDDEKTDATIADGEVGVLPDGEDPENEIDGEAGTTVTVYSDGRWGVNDSQGGLSADGVSGGDGGGGPGGSAGGSGADPASGNY